MKELYQTVVIKLDDGTVAFFTGRAVCNKGDNRRIVDIKFTEPKELPEDCNFAPMEEPQKAQKD